MAEPLVVLEGVNKSFGAQHVLRDIDLTVGRGEVVVVIGPSGSGKSTLCRTINRLETIDGGTITLDGRALPSEGRDLARLRSEVGMVFQSFNLFAHKSVLENVTLGPVTVRRTPRAEAERRARELLRRVGIEAHADKLPAQLSGGQQQRVAIARALVTRPEVVFADEPTGALDTRTGRGVLALLRELVDTERHTVVMVTHDPAAATYADRVVLLADGRIAGTLDNANADEVAEHLAHLGD
jgi:glutamate transport system ATP-binding protein